MTHTTYRPRTCKNCFAPMPHASTGRPRITCSDRCRQAMRRRYDYVGWIDPRRHDQTRRRAERQIRKYEKRFGDLRLIPGYRHDTHAMSLYDRLMIYQPRGWRVLECWTCGRPYMPDGQLSPTCSDACRDARTRHLRDQRQHFYANPYPTPPAIRAYIQAGKRVGSCAHCHAEFLPTDVRRKYCSAQCRKAAWWQRNLHWRCRECDAICEGRNHYCSSRCQSRAARRSAPVWIPVSNTCEECQQTYQPTDPHWQTRQRFCTDSCRHRFNYRIKTQRLDALAAPRFCLGCGTERPKHRLRYCSDACSHLADNESKRRSRARRSAIPIPAHLFTRDPVPIIEYALVGGK